jgi:hypothetical protein
MIDNNRTTLLFSLSICQNRTLQTIVADINELHKDENKIDGIISFIFKSNKIVNILI